jgi:hypothetical protein
MHQHTTVAAASRRRNNALLTEHQLITLHQQPTFSLLAQLP